MTDWLEILDCRENVMWYVPPTFPELQQHQVHLWWVKLDVDMAALEYATSFLDHDELSRASRFKFKNDRRKFIAGRAALRRLLGRYNSAYPNSIVFGYSEFNKPFLPLSNIEFNLSNSYEAAVIGFTLNHPMGVDVEWIKPAKQFPDDEILIIAKRFFAKSEYDRLLTVAKDDRRKAFFECWTRKESFIKAEGSGLLFPLDQFEVAFGGRRPAQLLSVKWDELEKQNWSLFNFEINSYLGAAAVRGRVDEWCLFGYDGYSE